MISLVYLIAALLFATLHWSLRRSARHLGGAVEIFLSYLFFFCVGLQGLVAAYFHTFRAAETAARIGWAPGSPFQFEVAMGNLGLGVIGILAVKFRRGFWLAVAVFNAVYLWGCAYGHMVQQRLGDNAPYNTGVFLWVGDVAVPLGILELTVVYFVRGKGDKP